MRTARCLMCRFHPVRTEDGCDQLERRRKSLCLSLLLSERAVPPGSTCIETRSGGLKRFFSPLALKKLKHTTKPVAALCWQQQYWADLMDTPCEGRERVVVRVIRHGKESTEGIRAWGRLVSEGNKVPCGCSDK